MSETEAGTRHNAYPKPTAPKNVFLKEPDAVLSGGEAVVITKAPEKPKYVLKPHLTERPLKGHEGLEALRKQLEASSPKRGQRRNNKEKK